MRHTSAQRALDLALSIAALVILSPIMAVVALLVRAEDGGPVIFRQLRAGQHGKPFRVLKFRSMHADVKGGPLLDQPLWPDGVPDSFVFKVGAGAEPALTRIGATLRRLSLDELPQLVNVLRGEMSLVGPRPEILPIVECYSLPQRRRLSVKPGITGWAQVNYPYGASVEDAREKLAYDLYYLRHRSLALDLRILLATVRVVVMQAGAR